MPELVILTGPIAAGKNTVADALTRRLTGQGRTVVVVDVDDVAALWVVIDAPVSVTLPRAQADLGRGRSRDPDFHHTAHRRFRELLPMIPADRLFDSERMDAEQIAAVIEAVQGAR